MGRSPFARSCGRLLLTAFASALAFACSSTEAPRPGADAWAVATATETDLRGGQSGGEGEGSLGPAAMPCACLLSAALGKVLELSGGCARVQVLDTFDIYPELAVGSVVGGVLQPACSGSDPIQVGEDVFFQFWPGAGEPCAERRACQSNCVPASVECGKACASSTAEACAYDRARSHQTGRFAALSASAAGVSFHFAGQSRTASIEELLSLSCWEEHERKLEEYQQSPRVAEPSPPPSQVALPSQSDGLDENGAALVPAPSPDPEECYSGP